MQDFLLLPLLLLLSLRRPKSPLPTKLLSQQHHQSLLDLGNRDVTVGFELVVLSRGNSIVADELSFVLVERDLLVSRHRGEGESWVEGRGCTLAGGREGREKTREQVESRVTRSANRDKGVVTLTDLENETNRISTSSSSFSFPSIPLFLRFSFPAPSSSRRKFHRDRAQSDSSDSLSTAATCLRTSSQS